MASGASLWSLCLDTLNAVRFETIDLQFALAQVANLRYQSEVLSLAA